MMLKNRRSVWQRSPLHSLYKKELGVLSAAILLSCCFLFLSAACSKSVSEISEADIKEILEETTKASNDRDIDGILKHLAPEVAIKVTGETPMGMETLTPDRAEYAKLTERGWFFAGTYSYRIEDIDIDIADDHQSAIATSKVFETTNVNGEILRSMTDEKLKMEIVDGKIKTTEMEAVIYR